MYSFTILIITLIHNVYGHNGYNYIIGGILDGTTQGGTWEDAEALCLSKYNTHLASIHSEADNNEVEEICKYSNYLIGDFCWIGLKNVGEVRTDGKFEWSDGTDFDYTNWAFTSKNILQPNFSGDCVLMTMKHENGPWNDRACGNGVYKFICNAPQSHLLGCYVGDKQEGSDNVYTICNDDQDRCFFEIDFSGPGEIITRGCSDSNECSYGSDSNEIGCEEVGKEKHRCCCANNGCNLLVP